MEKVERKSLLFMVNSIKYIMYIIHDNDFLAGYVVNPEQRTSTYQLKLVSVAADKSVTSQILG